MADRIHETYQEEIHRDEPPIVECHVHNNFWDGKTNPKLINNDNYFIILIMLNVFHIIITTIIISKLT